MRHVTAQILVKSGFEDYFQRGLIHIHGKHLTDMFTQYFCFLFLLFHDICRVSEQLRFTSCQIPELQFVAKVFRP